VEKRASSLILIGEKRRSIYLRLTGLLPTEWVRELREKGRLEVLIELVDLSDDGITFKVKKL